MAGARPRTDGPMTFEDLASLARMEANSTSLVPVRKDLHPSMKMLMVEAGKACERQYNLDITSLNADGARFRMSTTQTHTTNILRIRVEKICKMAAMVVLGGTVSVDGLPPEEKTLFNELVSSISKIWFLKDKKKITIPDIAPEMEPAKAVASVVTTPSLPKAVEETPLSEMPYIEDEPMESDETDSGMDIVDIDDAPIEPISEVVEEDTNDSISIIRIIDSVPPFSGPSRDYILKKGDLVKMPEMMAQILVDRGLATPIKS